MDQRISLITLAAADLDAARAFYENLGWEVTDATEGIVVFDLIGQTLGLYSKAGLARDMGLSEDEIGGFSGITLAHNLPTREAVDALYARFVEAGGRGVKAPHEVFWGGYTSYAADLDGHVWEIAHNPFSPLGPKGEFQWRGA
ncbi:VOC family protein [Psychromarinibacter sp. C21-152]|uniref:VOC family protein n=1 Tax=Psychromarinibacter sediminicola TaxID=3033385 RepID=A0AAE3T922_9RHOB|nr:VOC family protein [Psychromarinibacter sediminicola]MDF0600130.1 VOC family protein [Psychromarinibacter sediminicola]